MQEEQSSSMQNLLPTILDRKYIISVFYFYNSLDNGIMNQSLDLSSLSNIKIIKNYSLLCSRKLSICNENYVHKSEYRKILVKVL